MKAKKSVRREKRAKKKAKRDERFEQVKANVSDDSNLEDKTRIELLAIAVKKGLKTTPKMNRADLIDLIQPPKKEVKTTKTKSKVDKEKTKGDDIDFPFSTKKEEVKPQGEKDKEFTRIRKEDIETFKKALEFTSKDSLRERLTGVCLSRGKIVATDSLKMFFDDIGLELDETVILNGDDLKRALKGVKDTKDLEVKKLSKNRYEINGEPVRVIDDKYPEWRAIIPTNVENKMIFKKEDISKLEDKAEEYLKKHFIDAIKKEIDKDGLKQATNTLKSNFRVDKTDLSLLNDKDIDIKDYIKIATKIINKGAKSIINNKDKYNYIVLDSKTNEMAIRLSKISIQQYNQDSAPIDIKLKLSADNKKTVNIDSGVIAFNFNYFKKVANSSDNKDIEVGFNTTSRPAIFDGKAILMPIKLDAVSYSSSH
jgi:hypothetical protein